MALFHTTVLDNQIKALPTVDTASGSIATFDTDLTENLVSCVCQLPYRASGYSNISIFANSINKWNENWENGTFNTTTGININNSVVNAQIRSKNLIPILPNVQYYANFGGTLGWCIFYDNNNNVIENPDITRSQGASRSGNSVGIETGVYFAINENSVRYMKFYLLATYGSTYLDNISINYPSTETAYSPFKGVYTEFPSVVYGGSFEAVSGTLTSTYESDGTEKVTPDIIRCNGGQIIILGNETNDIYNDCGDTEVKYLLTVGKKIA